MENDALFLPFPPPLKLGRASNFAVTSTDARVCSPPRPVIPYKRIIDWTGWKAAYTLLIMGMTGQTSVTEAELEALIAKYTLEYLYRWTNEFDAKELAELRKLLASAPPEHIVQMIKTGSRALPN